MDTREITIFLKIVETNSFTAAAEAMYVSRSVVTYTIKKMESELGIKLLERNSHEIRLTTQGKMFYEDMKVMMGQWDHAQRRLRDSMSQKEALNIGMISMTLEEDFGRIIGRFMSEHSEIQPRIEVCPIEDPSRLVRAESMDVAFMYEDTVHQHPELEYVHLTEIPMYCVVNKNHPFVQKGEISIDDLDGQRIICFPESITNTVEGLTRFSSRFAATVGSRLTYLRSTNIAYTMSLVRQNAGITFLPVYPPSLVENPTIAFIPMSDYEEYLDICVVWKKGKKTPAIEALVAIAQEYFSQKC